MHDDADVCTCLQSATVPGVHAQCVCVAAVQLVRVHDMTYTEVQLIDSHPLVGFKVVQGNRVLSSHVYSNHVLTLVCHMMPDCLLSYRASRHLHVHLSYATHMSLCGAYQCALSGVSMRLSKSPVQRAARVQAMVIIH